MTTSTLLHVLERALTPTARHALAVRAGQVVAALTGRDAPASLDEVLDELEGQLAEHDPSHYWLAGAAISGSLPSEDEVQAMVRTSRLDGVRAALEPAIGQLAAQDAAGELPELEIVRDAVTMDVSHTSSVTFTSGIQRVVRECVHRWSLRTEVRLLSWTQGHRIFRPVTEEEWANVTLGRPVPPPTTGSGAVIVPWGGTYLVPELAVDPGRALRNAALARYAHVTVSLIGYDVIPLTTPSSVTDGMVGLFARYLAATSHVDRIAAISQAAADEYRGWSAMLAARGTTGPRITTVALPVHARPTTPVEMEQAREQLSLGAAPLVLVVGSHEPRKNHLAVLHAAELLWRDGHRFSIAFVGSGSWKAEAFYTRVAELQAEGRPVQSISGLSDDLLWAAYRLAHCVVFPSLNEGFGLPVAEALACGTPVVTSDFGSMAQIVAPEGEPLGGLLVDPHDDAAIAAAIGSLLRDRELHQRLSAEASTHRMGTWDEYAEALWKELVAE